MGKKAKKRSSTYTTTEKVLMLLIGSVMVVLTVLGLLGY